jgi:hypothetical protein
VTARRERGPGSAITPAVDAPASPGRRRLLVAGGSALGTLAAGCGSGIELAGVGSGGTGQVAFSSGPISGFGSVIVNEGNSRFYEPGTGRTVIGGLQWQREP